MTEVSYKIETLDPYNAGWNAFFDGLPENSNPYPATTASFADWNRGWQDALAQFERTS